MFDMSTPISGRPKAAPNDGPETPIFTARELSGALPISETAVRNTIDLIDSTDVKVKNGKPVKAWSITVLPARWLGQLMEETRRRGLRGLYELPDDIEKPKRPSISLANLPQAAVTKAGRLQRAFASTVARLGQKLAKAELARLGMPDYQREFGFAITERNWIRWLDLIEQRHRDYGHTAWDHLQLYLPDQQFALEPSKPDETPLEEKFPELANRLNSQPDRGNISDDALANLWDDALGIYQVAIGKGVKNGKRVKRELVQYLFDNVPGIAKSFSALDKTLRRDYEEWLANGKKLDSGRTKRTRGPELSDAVCADIIGYCTYKRGSRLATAWRDYLRGKAQRVLPDKTVETITPDPELVKYYLFNPRNKSHVPDKVRARLSGWVKALNPAHHGPETLGLTAWLQMDDALLSSMEMVSMDDLTAPIYYIDPNAPEGSQLIRGQILFAVDRRSRRVIGFYIIPEAAYNSIAILAFVASVCDDWGIPKCFEWEFGIWKRAKLLKGAIDQVSGETTEKGLQDLGIIFVHRTRPCGKIVENILARVQDLLEGEAGYCGRDERKDRYERNERLMRDVNAGRVSAEGKFYTHAQWSARLKQVCEEYNAEPHGGGTLLDGASPEDAFEKYWNWEDKPARLDARTRYLIATHERKTTIKGNGITFTIGGKDYTYHDGQTGKLPVREVAVRFNAEDPSFIFVKHPDTGKHFAVEETRKLHPYKASPEDLAEEHRKKNAHQKPVRAMYQSLSARWKPSFRANLVDSKTAQVSQDMREAAEQVKQTRGERSRKINQIHRNAEKLGEETPRGVDDSQLDTVLEGQRRQEEIRARLAAKQSKGTP